MDKRLPQVDDAWTKKRKIGRQKVSKSISGRDVKNMESAWHFAREIGKPLNRFITFRPCDINVQTLKQRIGTWTKWRNRLAQFARDNNFEFTCLWTRESERKTGKNEHLHILMHVPAGRLKRFDALVKQWPGDPQEIDCRPSTYQTQITPSGKQKNVLTYVTKNSPQAAYTGRRFYQAGGPILGKRCGTSRNLSPQTRACANVRGILMRDLRLGAHARRIATCPPHKRTELLNRKMAKSPVILEEKIRRKIENKSDNSSKLAILRAAA
jgi:hypothetical protein